MNADHLPLFLEGVELFNKEFYFECHDLWEELWSESKGKEKLCYQALIMSAVSLYHFDNENLEGALSCHEKSKERFSQLDGQPFWFDPVELFRDMMLFYSDISRTTELTPELLAKPRPKIKLQQSFSGSPTK